MADRNSVEIIVTGDEVLNGDVADTNSTYLIQGITSLGGYVTRVVIVRDNMESIKMELDRSIKNNAKIIITVGGLGPTPDDLTLKSIAYTLKRALEVNEQAREFIKERYETMAKNKVLEDATLTDSRIKMATLPRGSVPLENPVGTAPPVLTMVDSTMILSLPGVPAELKAIFEKILKPILINEFGTRVFTEKVLVLSKRDESRISGVLKYLSETYKDMYFKSRSQIFGNERKLTLTIAIRGDNLEETSIKINNVLNDIKERLLEVEVNIEQII
ncbi:MAG: competence/damage-inducible protein A [Thermoplasmata archaeon]